MRTSTTCCMSCGLSVFQEHYLSCRHRQHGYVAHLTCLQAPQAEGACPWPLGLCRQPERLLPFLAASQGVLDKAPRYSESCSVCDWTHVGQFRRLTLQSWKPNVGLASRLLAESGEGSCAHAPASLTGARRSLSLSF